jgi:acetyltransferase-like isoleucine patch superfamily enzyme
VRLVGQQYRCAVLRRDFPVPSAIDRLRGATKRAAGELVRWAWDGAVELGAIGPDSRRGRRFGNFGAGSIICFPPMALVNEHAIRIGSHTVIGPHITLSAGMMPGQTLLSDRVVCIGDRCLIGKGSGIVGHLSIEIGDDVWTGHHVYITDQNHGYEDITQSISRQAQPERPVRIGDGTWLGHGVVVLPGATIGRHVVVAAGSVVTGELPDHCVAAGSPARPIRRHVKGEGWVRVADAAS